MLTFLVLVIGYPVFLALLVGIDWLSGWQIREAFGAEIEEGGL